MDPDFAEVQALGSASIAALKEAVIAKLQLGVLPTYVTLTVVGAGAPLRSSLKLAVAIEKELLTDGAELIAKIHPPVASGASSSVSGACFAALQSLRAANPVHPAIVSLKRACGDASSLAASIPSHPTPPLLAGGAAPLLADGVGTLGATAVPGESPPQP